MPGTPSERLRELGLTLPKPAAPVGTYAPVVVEGGLAWVSGQIAMAEGEPLHPGAVDGTVGVAEAQEVARMATLQGLGALGAALGSIDRIRRVVRVAVYVAASPGFRRDPTRSRTARPELLIEIFGEAGSAGTRRDGRRLAAPGTRRSRSS